MTSVELNDQLWNLLFQKVIELVKEKADLGDNDDIKWELFQTNETGFYHIKSDEYKAVNTLTSNSVTKLVMKWLTSVESLSLTSGTFKFDYVKRRKGKGSNKCYSSIKNTDNL